MYLTYGQCPQCFENRQPNDGADDDGLEYCYCCSCMIGWHIVHTARNHNRETFLKIWRVIDIHTLDYIPRDC
jgi:hypothetical protein